MRAFFVVLALVAAAEAVIAVVQLVDGSPVAAAIAALAAVLTVRIARTFRRSFERYGPDDWRFSWRAFLRRLQERLGVSRR